MSSFQDNNSLELSPKWEKIMDYVLNGETIFSICGIEIDVSQFTFKLLVYGYYQEYKTLGYKRKRDLERGYIYVQDLERMQYLLHRFRTFRKISMIKEEDPIDNWEERPMDIVEN